MIVYHGSLQNFQHPDLSKSKTKIDFGRGFYLTQHRYDALDILDHRAGYLYKYDLQLENLNILDFSELPLQNWLDTIVSFRNLGTAQIENKYDIIIGNTAANTKIVFKEMQSNKCSRLTPNLIRKLQPKNRFPQIVLKTDTAIAQLTLLEMEEIEFD